MEHRPSSPSPLRPCAAWPAVVTLALVAAGFSVLNPVLLIFVPLAFLLVAHEPRKRWLMLIAVVLLATTFTGRSGDMLWWYGRGWALIVSAWFVAAIALLPAASLISRLLIAVAGASTSTALLFLTNRSGWIQLDWAVGRQLRNSAADVASFWTARLSEQPWAADLTSAVYRFAEFQMKTYPAMLAIASLAGLALAWFLWRRLSVQEPRPFGPLRDFRFRDELVWVVVIGAILVALPLGVAATRTGINLLLFMAALYAVRGLAVIVALFGSPSLLGALFGALLFLMLYPIMMATTLMVGLTDTWLDLRARRLTRQDNEKH
ncbi:MAG: DUF2232 domain-containing protein [Gemmatimonadota bacterium]